MCTLRNFPHAIEHCIEWARDVFAGTLSANFHRTLNLSSHSSISTNSPGVNPTSLFISSSFFRHNHLPAGSFTNAVQDAAAYAANPAQWLAAVGEEGNLAARRGKLQGVVEVLTAARTADWAACVRMAREAFNVHFTLQIKQLLHNFPLDYTDSNGVKFWSGPKRPPTAAEFDPADAVHFAYVTHAAALYAYNFGVPMPAGWDSHDVIDPILAGISVPPFVPKGVKIKTSETDTTVEGGDDDADAVASLTSQLQATAAAGGSSSGTSLAGVNLTPADFEKDDDSNHHIDFITAAANLRARNYKIREATRYEVKMTAGKIIPAIATTTCMVTGLVAIEMYKVIQKKVRHMPSSCLLHCIVIAPRLI